MGGWVPSSDAGTSTDFPETGHVLKTPAGKRVQSAFAETFPNLQNEFIANNLPPARVFTARMH